MGKYRKAHFAGAFSAKLAVATRACISKWQNSRIFLPPSARYLRYHYLPALYARLSLYQISHTCSLYSSLSLTLSERGQGRCWPNYPIPARETTALGERSIMKAARVKFPRQAVALAEYSPRILTFGSSRFREAITRVPCILADRLTAPFGPAAPSSSSVPAEPSRFES